MITIEQANKESIGIVSKILTEAALWLKSIEQPLWPVEEVSVDAIFRDMPNYYICFADRRAAGTVRYQLEDPAFWPEISDGKSAFIHKLAVCREFAGKSISTALLNWAVNSTRSKGRHFLRVDFDPARYSLKRFYEGFGFVFHSPKQMGSFLTHRYMLDVK